MAQSDVTVLSEVHRTRASHRKQQSWPAYANDVLAETLRWRGITARLTEKWHDLSQETTEAPPRHLKERGWNVGKGSNRLPGPALRVWRVRVGSGKGNEN